MFHGLKIFLPNHFSFSLHNITVSSTHIINAHHAYHHHSVADNGKHTENAHHAYHQLINRDPNFFHQQIFLPTPHIISKFIGKHKRRRKRAKGSRFGKGTDLGLSSGNKGAFPSGGSDSTGREAIEEKKRKMKRWN